MSTRHARIRVGMAPDSLEIEIFQPICLDHHDPWTGPETFDEHTARLNATVHDTDKHRDVP